MIITNELWHSIDENDWIKILDSYKFRIQAKNLELENLLENNLFKVKSLHDLETFGLGNCWYDFMLNKYFKWKYTAANRYATTTKFFKKAYFENNNELILIIEQLLNSENKFDSFLMIKIATRIKGLGVAGASGFLSLLMPEIYGTVDQFLVENLQNINILQEKFSLKKINKDNIKYNEFVILTEILRNKSLELNKKFSTSFWTPRKIDKVLWTIRQ